MQTTTRCALAGFLVILTIPLSTTAKKMTKQFLNLDGHKPPGYTHVVTSPPGKMIFISGRAGAAGDGTMPPDFGAQAKNTFEDLKRCLAMAGASFKDVVKINYFVTDLSKTTELRQIRAQYLDIEHPPAATLVQIALPGGSLVQIDPIAFVPQ